jgi:tRNA pseudouridine38-40 synthase
MRKILLTIEYFGKNYAGWQCQKDAISVQGVVEEKLSKVFSKPIKIYGSGRTDSGVHAFGQRAHFFYEGNLPDTNIASAVNCCLPDDIRIVSSKEIFDADFHAQYSAKIKTYMYRFYISRTLSPLRNLMSAQIPYDMDRLDYEKMQNAVKNLVGTHNFKGFSSTGSNIKNTIRTIYEATLSKENDEITFIIKGNGFLYNMVRIIAGTLVYIGLGSLPEDAIEQTLTTKLRKNAGKTFPAHGLTLVSVEY